MQDKYLDVVKDCFQANSSMHKALKDAFECFCNKQVGSSQTPELMANFCDTLLRKGGGERLSDEDMEATLDKVCRLLVYINDRDMFGCVLSQILLYAVRAVHAQHVSGCT